MNIRSRAKVIAVFAVASALVVGLTACDPPPPTSNPAQDQAIETAQQRENYVPQNDVEGYNYNARQELADDPATILWCTIYPPYSTVKPSTVPIVGKLTSGNKRPYPTSVTKDFESSYDTQYYPELPGSDGFYGSSAEYRYGFDPAGGYHEWYGMGTDCTTVPNIVQTQTTLIAIGNADGDLATLTQQAYAALVACRAINPDPSVPCIEAVKILGGL